MTDMAHRSVAWISVLTLAAVLSTAADVRADESSDEPPPAASESADQEHKNVLRWATASEVDNFGYDIYRGDSEDGPFERVTAEPLLGAGTTDETSQYEFVDTAIDPYEPYWYYVESISKAGKRERFTPIFKTEPQLKRESEPESTEDDQ